MPERNLSGWNDFIKRHPDAHLLQTGSWGELKAAFGWEAIRLVSGDVGAQILFRKLPLGFTLAYIPKGPVGQSWEPLWPEVDSLCRRHRAVFLKVEPDLQWEGPGTQDRLPPPGFQSSSHRIQPARTLMVDLEGDEGEVLQRMKAKTRYNIRLAMRKGVVVHPSGNLGAFANLIHITGQRDQFGVHAPAYYQKAYDLFHPSGNCELLIAEFEKEPLAGLMVFAHGRRAWYLYGASSNAHRNRMPSYALQWEAIRWARSQGCQVYDLWGVPDEEVDSLEAQFSRRSDGLWGVYRFKRGFGGKLTRSAGAWDRVYQPGLYFIYRWWSRRRAIE